MTEYRIVSDDDGHDYLIPVGEEDRFKSWISYMENNSPGFAWMGRDYDRCRINPYRLIIKKYKVE